MFVQDVMTREPVTVTRGTTIKHAAGILVEHQISSLPVLDERGCVCGVLSEADLIRDAFVPDARGTCFLASTANVRLRPAWRT